MADQAMRAVGALGLPRWLVLGIDPGIASCGFALLDLNNHEILEMGVRLFPQPSNPKSNKSLAAERRGHRSARRNLDRTQARLERCLGLLKKHGVVPPGATKEYFHTVKGDKPPLRLRAEGLDRLLSDREWAIVLYSICKRRGYIPHGERDAEASDDDGKVLKAIAANEKAYAESGFRTVGEWLANKEKNQEKSRNRQGSYDMCITHAQLAAELRLLFQAQRSFGAAHASEDMEKAYFEIFDWQKPRGAFDAAVYASVGSCVYFPDEKRAARCTLSSEMVAAYGALDNVVVVMPDATERRLSAQERDRYIETLFSPVPAKKNKDCKVTYAAIRKDLDLPSRAFFKGVKADNEKKREPYAPKGWRLLRETLDGREPTGLAARLRADRGLADAVMEAAAYSSSAKVFKERLTTLDLEDDEVEALCGLPYASRVLNGYGTRSRKALDMLLDAFADEGVLTLTEAEKATGLDRARLADTDVERSDRLVPYEVWLQSTGRTNNNPVVLRAVAQTRKVVNAVCREWGVPDEIHVELDRELLLPKKAKQEIAQSQNKNAEANKAAATVIAEFLGCRPEDVKGDLVAKYRLWEAQGKRDMYTGDCIEFVHLIGDEKYTEVDHVLPLSRTGDNSRHNKVLVLAKSNQEKGDRSPYEWMAESGEEDAPSWDEFEARVRESKGMHWRKRANLLERDLRSKEAEFLERNLTDTAYLSREVCAYLSDCLAFPDDGLKAHVVPTKGQATAWLRRAWGLNFGTAGEKDRSDDRHHATDACVVAACSRGLVKKTARYSEKRRYVSQEERDRLLAEGMPWEGFAQDVRARREGVVPTRFVPRKGTGQAFEETNYAYVGTRDDGRDVLRAGGNLKPAGNAVVSEDGKSAQIVGDMVCLRLWHDPEARPKGKVKGQWYADPIYVADLPALENGTYVPRIAKAHVGRKSWEPIPERVLEGRPVEIYLGDVVRVGEWVGRLQGFNIGGVRWAIVDPLTREEIGGFPTIGSLGNEMVPVVVREDVLGRCWS